MTLWLACKGPARQNKQANKVKHQGFLGEKKITGATEIKTRVFATEQPNQIGLASWTPYPQPQAA